MWYFLAMFAIVTCTSAFIQNRLQIPNGINVPNPCPGAFGLWNAVGHIIQTGGLDTNVFGDDFLAAGVKWTTDLCQMDSDSDGRTNGEELGDLNCTWSFGKPNPMTNATGHPGICEPMSDVKCKDINQNILCHPQFPRIYFP